MLGRKRIGGRGRESGKGEGREGEGGDKGRGGGLQIHYSFGEPRHINLD